MCDWSVRIPTVRCCGRVATLALLALLALLAVVASSACGGGGAVDGSEGDVVFEATEYAFEPAGATVDAGAVAVVLDNRGQLEHTWTIDGMEGRIELRAGSGEQDAGTVELEAGTYTFYCDVPGHRQLGMEGTLTVE